MIKRRITILILMFYPILAIGSKMHAGKSVYVLTEEKQEIDLREYVNALEDPMDSHSFSSIKELDFSMSGEALEKLKHENVYWGRLEVFNKTTEDVNYILDIGENNYAELVTISKGKTSPVRKSGELVLASEKDVVYGRKASVFNLRLLSGDTTIVYFKLKNVVRFSPVMAPTLTQSNTWFETIRRESMVQAMFQGLLWILILYAFVIYLIYRGKAYLYFSLYILCFSIYFLWYEGIIHEFLTPELPFFNIYIWIIPNLITAFYWQFIRYFLNTKKQFYKWDKALLFQVRLSYTMFFLCLILFSITFNRPLVSAITNNVIMLQLLFGLVFLVVLLRSGNILFRLVVYGSFLFAAFTLTGIFIYHFYEYQKAIYYVQLGKIFEFLVFSIGLGYRIYLVDIAKKSADKKLIAQLEKNEELQKKVNQKLGKTLSQQDGLLKQKNEDLEHTIEKLQLANKELSSYAHIISHDLKAPLRAIGTLTDWIDTDQKDNLDDKGKQQFLLLKNRVTRMYGLIEGVLSYSKAGKLNENSERVDIRSLITSVVESISPSDKFNIQVMGNFPTLKISPTPVVQVFQNLIENAMKFMDKEIGEIKISCRRMSDFWQFEIKDNGPGIDKQYGEKVFEIFQTLKSKDEYESSGIGLSIVKKIVEMEKGKIWFESQLNKGTQFYFTLPVQHCE